MMTEEQRARFEAEQLQNSFTLEIKVTPLDTGAWQTPDGIGRLTTALVQQFKLSEVRVTRQGVWVSVRLGATGGDLEIPEALVALRKKMQDVVAAAVAAPKEGA